MANKKAMRSDAGKKRLQERRQAFDETPVQRRQAMHMTHRPGSRKK